MQRSGWPWACAASCPGFGSWRRCSRPLPLLALEFYVLGYFDVASGLPPSETGYIESSMNLLSPLLGTQLAPSLFLPSKGLVLDATGMQIDGHNYLGVALLGMLLFMVLRSPRWLLARCRHHWVLVALCVGLTIYALSNRIYLSNLVVLEYPLPSFIEPLTKIFRGSGRFFWPVGYILLMAAIGYFLTRVNPVYRLALLVLIAVQYVDMRHHRAYVAEAPGVAPISATTGPSGIVGSVRRKGSICCPTTVAVVRPWMRCSCSTSRRCMASRSTPGSWLASWAIARSAPRYWTSRARRANCSSLARTVRTIPANVSSGRCKDTMRSGVVRSPSALSARSQAFDPLGAALGKRFS